MNKEDIMEAFLFFCRDYGVMGRFHPGEMTFSFLSPSLGWTDISYTDLHRSFPDRFPEYEPVQVSLF